MTRRAFGAGAALVAAGLESSTKAARAFERPPPRYVPRAKPRCSPRETRERSLIVHLGGREKRLLSLSKRAPLSLAPLRSRLFARASSLAPLRFTRLTDGDDSIVVLHLVTRDHFTQPLSYRPFNDTIDGYKLFRPDDWIEVKGSGNDVFFRNPASAEENLFVGISSPSSTKFDSPRYLGSPEDAARKVLEQTLTEFMSTRIGVRRESSVVSATERVGVGVDGEPMVFYDCVFRVASYATKNQYGLTEADRPQSLEWDRTLSSTLGVANNRLYELRTRARRGRRSGARGRVIGTLQAVRRGPVQPVVPAVLDPRARFHRE